LASAPFPGWETSLNQALIGEIYTEIGPGLDAKRWRSCLTMRAAARNGLSCTAPYLGSRAGSAEKVTKTIHTRGATCLRLRWRGRASRWSPGPDCSRWRACSVLTLLADSSEFQLVGPGGAAPGLSGGFPPAAALFAAPQCGQRSGRRLQTLQREQRVCGSSSGIVTAAAGLGPGDAIRPSLPQSPGLAGLAPAARRRALLHSRGLFAQHELLRAARPSACL